MRASAVLAVLALAVVSLGAGCGRAAAPSARPRTDIPEPAVSPPLRTTPAGRLVPLSTGSAPEGIAIDAATSIIAVAVRQPDGVDLLATGSGAARSFVALEGAARHLALVGPGGPLLVPNETSDRLDEVALPGGNLVASIPVGRQPHDAAAMGAGEAATIFVGDEVANTVHVIRNGQVVAVVPAPLEPGGVAATGGRFAVVGVRGRRMTIYRPDGSVVTSIACGVGPTHVVAGPAGLLYVADTEGDAVLAFRLSGSHVTQVARIPVGPVPTSRARPGTAPYGIAYDAARGELYVTLTGTNQLLGLHLAGTRVISRRLWPTARQPNTVAVDAATGQVAVTGTDAGVVELITP